MARGRARGGRRGDAVRRLRHPRERGAAPASRRETAAVASPAPASPAPPASPSALPSSSPSTSSAGPPYVGPPAPSSRAREAALAAAVRRVEAAARVNEALPAFDQLAAGMVARSGVPGAVVAIVAGDTAAYVRCFGLREVGSPDKVTEDTLFQLGAVSRSYTTTMLAALAGEGELRWDQPVRRVWPGFRLRDRWATREATFRDLTAQRSGLPAYAGTELVPFGYGRGEVLRRLRYLRPPPASALPTRHRTRSSRRRRPAQSGPRRLVGGLVRMRVLEPIGDAQTVLGYRASRPRRTRPRRIGSSPDRWCPRTRPTRRCSRRRSASAPASARSCRSLACSSTVARSPVRAWRPPVCSRIPSSRRRPSPPGSPARRPPALGGWSGASTTGSSRAPKAVLPAAQARSSASCPMTVSP